MTRCMTTWEAARYSLRIFVYAGNILDIRYPEDIGYPDIEFSAWRIFLVMLYNNKVKKGSVFIYIVIVFLVCVAFFAGIFFLLQRSSRPEAFINSMSTLQLTSSVFVNNSAIPSKYTCDGDDVNPSLAIARVPEGAKSLVLIMDDPDAPVGMWDHWVVFNIPPSVSEIAEGEEPQGVHGKGTSGNLGYKGPCPPDKEHRYFFKLYALDTELDLQEGVSKKDVEKAMEGHILGKAELIGLYERTR